MNVGRYSHILSAQPSQCGAQCFPGLVQAEHAHTVLHLISVQVTRSVSKELIPCLDSVEQFQVITESRGSVT